MQLTCSPTVCPDLDLSAALDFIKQAGFNRIELFRAFTQSTPVQDNISVPMVRDQLAAAGVTLTGFNIRNLTGRKADSDERNLGYNLRQLEWDIHMGRALGLQSISLKGGARTDEALVDLIFGVNRLLENIPDITLNLGNHKDNRLECLADFQTILPHLNERARILMDTGHLLSVGEDPLAFANALSTRIGVVHLRDQKGEKPVAFGEGDLPLKELLGVLQEAGYNGELVIELEEVDWDEPLAATIVARQYVEKLLE
jgi:sugar phosphate isomerase/epimerase